MVDRSELWLGRHVAVRLCGGETVGAVVDGLCNDWVGVRLDQGGYVIADWEDIEVEEEEEVVHTEQGEVLARKSEEESVPNDLEEAAEEYAKGYFDDCSAAKRAADHGFIAGAKWQAEQDQETIELAEDHAYFAGKEKMREELLEWLNIVKKQSEQLKDDGYGDIFYGAQIAILEEVIKKINNYEHH